MTQTATVLAHGQALYITEIKNQIVDSTTADSTSNTIKNFHFHFSESGLFKVKSTFLYKRRGRFCLTIGEEFKQHFILIKGLIEFHRSKELKFTFHRSENVLEVDLEVRRFNELDQLLVNVNSWLRQELQFKAALKKVIEMESRYKAEIAGVYDILRGTLATQPQ